MSKEQHFSVATHHYPSLNKTAVHLQVDVPGNLPLDQALRLVTEMRAGMFLAAEYFHDTKEADHG